MILVLFCSFVELSHFLQDFVLQWSSVFYAGKQNVKILSHCNREMLQTFLLDLSHRALLSLVVNEIWLSSMPVASARPICLKNVAMNAAIAWLTSSLSRLWNNETQQQQQMLQAFKSGHRICTYKHIETHSPSTSDRQSPNQISLSNLKSSMSATEVDTYV